MLCTSCTISLKRIINKLYKELSPGVTHRENSMAINLPSHHYVTVFYL